MDILIAISAMFASVGLLFCVFGYFGEKYLETLEQEIKNDIKKKGNK